MASKELPFLALLSHSSKMLISGCDEIFFHRVSPINFCSLCKFLKCLRSSAQNKAAYRPYWELSLMLKPYFRFLTSHALSILVKEKGGLHLQPWLLMCCAATLMLEPAVSEHVWKPCLLSTYLNFRLKVKLCFCLSLDSESQCPQAGKLFCCISSASGKQLYCLA